MKRIAVLIIVIFSFTFGFAQTEKANYKKVATEFQHNYNNGDIVSIFNMFNDNYKKVLNLEKTKAFFKETINAESMGNIKSMTLTKIERTGHTYNIEFENGISNTFFLLDDNNKIKGFLMYPPKKKEN